MTDARAIVGKFIRNLGVLNTPSIDDQNMLVAAIRDALTTARREASLAMREQCAKVAKDAASFTHDLAGKTDDDAKRENAMCASALARDIEGEIRALSAPPPPAEEGRG